MPADKKTYAKAKLSNATEVGKELAKLYREARSGRIDVSDATRSTLYLRIKQRLMTPPIKLGERCAAWPADEIAAINAARIAGKTNEEIRELVAKLEQQRTAKAE